MFCFDNQIIHTPNFARIGEYFYSYLVSGFYCSFIVNNRKNKYYLNDKFYNRKHFLYAKYSRVY